MSPYLRIAQETALAAGRILRHSARQGHKIRVWEKNKNDPVSETDLECEKEIVDRLTRAYPDHGILSEEDTTANRQADMRWVIDPIDGTRNFASGIAHFAISLALTNKQDILVGVVYDPIKEEMFCAEQGGGAHLNQKRIRVGAYKTIAGSMLATGIPYCESHDIDAYMKTLNTVVRQGVNIRRMGAASLDLAYVACARFDAFWEFGLQPWDIAAGILLVREAGGLVKEASKAGKGALDSGDILAGNPDMVEKMSAALAQTPRPARI